MRLKGILFCFKHLCQAGSWTGFQKDICEVAFLLDLTDDCEIGVVDITRKRTRHET